MSVLKLKPACKDYIWGGNKLKKYFNKEFEGDILAETWELSCHKDGASIIDSGKNRGMTLNSYIKSKGRDVLGSNCEVFEEFPILVKLIDAKENLSIQVHPDNNYALENEGQFGKTEMWYIIDCDEDAYLYYGFSKKIDKQEFEKRIKENTLLDVLNKVYVKKGDVLFIEAGTIHAIGKGIVIAEVQQNSNVTYRVYDYGRVGVDGKKRDLHIEKALDVTNKNPFVKEKSFCPHIAVCDYFTVDKVYLDGVHTKKINGYVGEDSFLNILVIEGEGRIWSQNDIVNFKKGDSLFIPAKSGEYEITGNFEALNIRV